MDDLRPKLAAKLYEVRELDDVPPLTRFQAALFGGFYASWDMVFSALSVLVEPPTCTVRVAEAQGPRGRHILVYRCSRCGADPWADYESVTNFCPECGAKVVADDGSD